MHHNVRDGRQEVQWMKFLSGSWQYEGRANTEGGREGRASEGDVVQVRRKSRLGKN